MSMSADLNTAHWETPCGAPSKSPSEVLSSSSDSVNISKNGTGPRSDISELTEFVTCLKDAIGQITDYKEQMAKNIDNTTLIRELEAKSIQKLLTIQKTANECPAALLQLQLKALLEEDYKLLSELFVLMEACKLDRERNKEDTLVLEFRKIETKLLKCLCRLVAKNIDPPTEISRDIAIVHKVSTSAALRDQNDYLVAKDAIIHLESLKNRYQQHAVNNGTG